MAPLGETTGGRRQLAWLLMQTNTEPSSSRNASGELSLSCFIVQRWRAVQRPGSQPHRLSGERRYWKHQHCKGEPTFLARSPVSIPWWRPSHIPCGELQEECRSLICSPRGG